MSICMPRQRNAPPFQKLENRHDKVDKLDRWRRRTAIFYICSTRRLSRELLSFPFYWKMAKKGLRGAHLFLRVYSSKWLSKIAQPATKERKNKKKLRKKTPFLCVHIKKSLSHKKGSILKTAQIENKFVSRKVHVQHTERYVKRAAKNGFRTIQMFMIALLNWISQRCLNKSTTNFQISTNQLAWCRIG